METIYQISLKKTENYYTGRIENLIDGEVLSKCGTDKYTIMRNLVNRIQIAESTINVGDYVIITNPGKTYTTYSNWFDLAMILPSTAAKYRYDGEVPNRDDTYKVIAKHPHHAGCNEMLYLITNHREDRVYLIHGDGIRKN